MRNSVVAVISTASTLAVCVLVSALMAAKTDRDTVFGAALRFRGNADSGLRLALQAGMGDGNLAADNPTPPTPPTPVSPPSADGSGKSTDTFLSKRRCSRMAPWGDICVYDNVCFSEGLVKFVDPDRPENRRERGRTCSFAPPLKWACATC